MPPPLQQQQQLSPAAAAAVPAASGGSSADFARLFGSGRFDAQTEDSSAGRLPQVTSLASAASSGRLLLAPSGGNGGNGNGNGGRRSSAPAARSSTDGASFSSTGRRRTGVTRLGDVSVASWCSLYMGMSLGWMLGYSFSSTTLLPRMPPWLDLFFPEARRIQWGSGGVAIDFCNFVSVPFSSYVASRYASAALAVLPAAALATKYGRRTGVVVSCVLYLIGQVLLCTAFRRAQLLVGSVVLGVSVGGLMESIVLGLAEASPAAFRGAFETAGMLGSSFGFFCGVAVMWQRGLRNHEIGWRIATAVGSWPALVVLCVLPWLVETPEYLVSRGRLREAREALAAVRGPLADIDAELNEIWLAATRGPTTAASRAAGGGTDHGGGAMAGGGAGGGGGWGGGGGSAAAGGASGRGFDVASVGGASLWQQLCWLRHPQHLIPVLMCALCGLLREALGSHLLAPMLPPLFSAAFRDASLGIYRGALLIEGLYTVGHAVAVLLVEHPRVGRRRLLISGATVSALCWCAMAAVLSRHETIGGLKATRYGVPFVMAMFCLLAIALGWSWQGAWAAIVADSHAASVRVAGIGCSIVATLCARVVVQVSMDSALCRFEWRLLFVAAGLAVLMILTAALLLPEGRGVPLDQVERIWQQHWLWGRWCGGAGGGGAGGGGGVSFAHHHWSRRGAPAAMVAAPSSTRGAKDVESPLPQAPMSSRYSLPEVRAIELRRLFASGDLDHLPPSASSAAAAASAPSAGGLNGGGGER